MRIAASLALSLMIAGSAAPALADETTAAPATAPAPAAKPDKNSPNRIICRSEDQIGSLLRKQRICMTAAQWRDVANQSNQRIEHYQTNNGIRGGG